MPAFPVKEQVTEKFQGLGREPGQGLPVALNGNLAE
jgi:hypothetical protein